MTTQGARWRVYAIKYDRREGRSGTRVYGEVDPAGYVDMRSTTSGGSRCRSTDPGWQPALR